MMADPKSESIPDVCVMSFDDLEFLTVDEIYPAVESDFDFDETEIPY